MMVSDASVPEDLVDGAKEVFSSNGTLVDPGPYVGAARGQHLSPTSEAALTKIGPKVKVKLIVTLEITRGKLLVTFRDGSTGNSISETKLAAHGKHPKLAARSSKKLNGATKRALAKLGGHAVSEPEERDDDMDEPEATPPARPAAPVQAARPAPPPAASANQGSAGWNDGEGQPNEEHEGEDTPEPAAAGSGGDTADSFHIHVTLGGGAGGRELVAPTKSGGVDVNTGFAFPALELGLAGGGMLSSQWFVSGEVVYRSIFGLHAIRPLDGSLVSMSSHNVKLGVAPGYRFGAKDSADLRLFLGYAFRFLSSSDPSVAGSNINGVVIQPDLRLPIAGGVLTLRIAPELIVVLGSEVVLAGNVAGLASVGVGFGGEIALDVRLAQAISLGLEYRESRAFVGSAWNISMFDMERYALAHIILTL